MRFLKGLLVAAAVLTMSANYVSADVVIGGAVGAGNGDFFSDPTGVNAPAAVSVFTAGTPNALSTNSNGRALTSANQGLNGDFTNVPGILNNRGVDIEGWTTFRREYIGGNDALGFLENGGRLGKANAANDGQAFANSGPYFLISDDITLSGSVGDVFDFSVLGGSDSGSGSFDLDVYLVFDDGSTGTLIQENTGTSAATTTYSGTYTTTAAYSSVRLGFEVISLSGTRVLLDDARLNVTPIPEPSSLAMLGLGGLVAGIRRRR